MTFLAYKRLVAVLSRAREAESAVDVLVLGPRSEEQAEHFGAP